MLGTLCGVGFVIYIAIESFALNKHEVWVFAVGTAFSQTYMWLFMIVIISTIAWAIHRIKRTVDKTKFTELKTCYMVVHWVMLTIQLCLITVYFGISNKDLFSDYKDLNIFFVITTIAVYTYQIFYDSMMVFILFVLHMMVRPKQGRSNDQLESSLMLILDTSAESTIKGLLENQRKTHARKSYNCQNEERVTRDIEEILKMMS